MREAPRRGGLYYLTSFISSLADIRRGKVKLRAQAVVFENFFSALKHGREEKMRKFRERTGRTGGVYLTYIYTYIPLYLYTYIPYTVHLTPIPSHTP